MTDSTLALDRAIDLYRRGDPAAARREAEAALAAEPSNRRLLHFLGTLCCRTGALGEGVRYFERALEADPADTGSRLNLVKAHIALGGADAALVAASVSSPDEPIELVRLRGQLLQAKDRHPDAAAAYERVVARMPGDWEIWNNLGNARRSLGDLEGAVVALERAASLRPDMVPIHMNLGSARIAAGRPHEAAADYGTALALDPGNPAIALEGARLLRSLGRFEDVLTLLADIAPSPEVKMERARAFSALRRLDEAETVYRSVLDEKTDFPEAWLELGIVLERSGRLAEVPAMLSEAARSGIEERGLAYLHALILDRDRKTDEALALLETAPPDLEPARTQRLIARLADKADRPALAFAAAGRANAEDVDSSEGRRRAADFRRRVERMIETVTEDWHARWSPPIADAGRPAPVFLVGFPRSGTTLLDTMLMGHPGAHVLEEIPLLGSVMTEVGEFARIAELDRDEVVRLRGRYFTALDEAAPPPPGSHVVDKLPLNLLGVPLIHRIFPDARIILALRHPCDVVLSCYMQGFEINDAMANFLDLGDAARLYDLVLTFWKRCEALLPLRVHVLRYERLVTDPEATMRPLLDFMGMEWSDHVLDHTRTAVKRGVISSPSYNQVTRHMYREASGRWRRYREQMAPVLPLLLPWAERLGYED